MNEVFPAHRKPLTDKQTYWLRHIQAARDSGLSNKDYARREGLSLSSMGYHATRLRKLGHLPSAKATFVPARVTDSGFHRRTAPASAQRRAHRGRRHRAGRHPAVPGAWPVMLRPSNDIPQVYLCAEPVDMRKSIDGLAALVEGALSLNPFSEHLFVFINRKRDKLKCLYWETNGFCLWYKRLEKQRFQWPLHLAEGDTITLTGQQLNWLFDGYDLRYLKPHQPLRYQSIL